MTNPLFPDDPNDRAASKQDEGYVLPRGKERRLEPASQKDEPKKPGAEEAANLIRDKIKRLYADEPAAKQELAESSEVTPPRSKHQQFMYELSTSGKSLADIQTAWHNYYIGLPDDEKHAVWQEFYAANARRPSTYAKFVQEQGEAKTTETGEPEVPLKPTKLNASKARRKVSRTKQKLHGDKAADGLNLSEAELAAKAKATAEAHATEAASLNAETTAGMVNPSGTVVSLAEETPADKPSASNGPRTASALRRQVLKKVRMSNAAQLKAKQHAQSLLFGISMGALTLVVVLFSFFNEVIITPFIQPSRHVSATPIILSSSDITPSSMPEVIIPKINVEIPVNYSLTTDDEATVENALEGGVVHYASTVLPGQTGNTAFFGHSSNNIFNPGKYKFAFVLLHTLVPGDIFYLTYNGTVYTYKVYDKQVVDPSDVAVLNNVPDKTATATLITCDPPGTSLHRLVVWGEQISPDPSGDTAGKPNSNAAQAKALASNGPSLWSRFVHWLF